MFAKRHIMTAAVALATAQLTLAATPREKGEIFFYPLTQSAAVATVAGDSGKQTHFNEVNHPWQTPPGVKQENLTSMKEIEADTAQSVVRVPGVGSSASMWDMAAFDPSGQYIFIPHETPMGAGVTRYSIEDDSATLLFQGNGMGVRGTNGDWSNDFGAFDPATFTPNGTLFLAEEWSGQGRVVEVMDPMTAVEGMANYRVLESIPNVGHEGLRFSHDGGTLYFVDEDNSGSIYKIVFDNPADYAAGGDVYVLSVDQFIPNGGNPAANWNSGVNEGIRTGAATWVALEGTTIDPYQDGIATGCSNPLAYGGRCAANEVGGTPFGRPEDMEVSKLRSGETAIYVAATSEQRVYTIVEKGNGKAEVKIFVGDTETAKNLDFPATTAVLNSPDNLAQDAYGNIFVIEDQPNGNDRGGDIWFARDTNRDGVAESLDHFMSIVADGAEATGMIFSPVNPDMFIVNVQHPDSVDLDSYTDGQGDALWMFDLSEVSVPPYSRAATPAQFKNKK